MTASTLTVFGTERAVPEVTIERLSIYSRVLRSLELSGRETISSAGLARHTPYAAAQIRRDLAWFGQFGTRGKGYDVTNLRRQLDVILGVHVTRRAALIGAGNLGLALLGYTGFREHNFEFAAAFDANRQKVGTYAQGVRIYAMSEIAAVVADTDIEIAVLAVPAVAAQDCADAAVRAGIKALLNFAPTQLSVPDGVQVRNVDLSVELEHLSYFLERRQERIGRIASSDPP